MRRSIIALSTLLLGLLLAGCSTGVLQTARTAPPGTTEVTVAGGYLYNEMVEERGDGLDNYPLQVRLRRGITERLDMGAALFMFAGGLIDAKYNLMEPDQPLAISMQGGAGYASAPISGAKVAHLPLRLLASYDVQPAITPYAGLGLGLYWISDYDAATDLPPGAMPVERAGHGDGVASLTAGVDVRGYVLEYTYLLPAFDDPGDGFAFVDNHLFLFGRRF